MKQRRTVSIPLFMTTLAFFIAPFSENARADEVCPSELYEDVSPTKESFHVDEVGTVIVEKKHINQHGDASCTKIHATWKQKGKSFSQLLLQEWGPGREVQGDKDGLVVITRGNRFAYDGFGIFERFRYDTKKNEFYSAELWESDDWKPYVAQVEQHLNRGEFSKALALVEQRGTTPNSGHSNLAAEFFFLFSKATHREAARAWKHGRKEAAASLVYKLLTLTPFVCQPCDEKEYMVKIPVVDGQVVGGIRYAALPANKETHVIVNDLAFFLSESEHVAYAAPLLEEVVRLAQDRAVAWLNLGDTYAKLGQQEKAVEAYRTYSTLMGKEGKSDRVPQRVKAALK